MPDKLHTEILSIIKANSGSPTLHTFSDSYLGNTHPRYPIDVPTLRVIAKEWMRANKNMTAARFQKLLTSLIKGKSSTEKTMAGILLDASTKEQRKFNPFCFDGWLDHLVGWSEIDSVCTGKYTITEIPPNFEAWKKLLLGFSKSKNINKRRASLVFLCSPLSQETNAPLARLALTIIDKLKNEKEILITKAISWLLRSMVRYHKSMIADYVKSNRESLPAIAVRETMVKIETGKKTARL
jgi:3-methyladenine DNA glycosylase AlkD